MQLKHTTHEPREETGFDWMKGLQRDTGQRRGSVCDVEPRRATGESGPR